MYPELYISSYFCPGFKIFSSNFPDFEVFEPGFVLWFLKYRAGPAPTYSALRSKQNTTVPHQHPLCSRKVLYLYGTLFENRQKSLIQISRAKGAFTWTKIIKNGQFLGFLKTRSFWPNSVTRQVTFNRTKFG